MKQVFLQWWKPKPNRRANWMSHFWFNWLPLPRHRTCLWKRNKRRASSIYHNYIWFNGGLYLFVPMLICENVASYEVCGAKQTQKGLVTTDSSTGGSRQFCLGWWMGGWKLYSFGRVEVIHPSACEKMYKQTLIWVLNSAFPNCMHVMWITYNSLVLRTSTICVCRLCDNYSHVGLLQTIVLRIDYVLTNSTVVAISQPIGSYKLQHITPANRCSHITIMSLQPEFFKVCTN